MVQASPPNASGIVGRGRIATIGEINCWNQFINNSQTNITIQPTSTTTNIPTINSIRDGTTSAAAAPMTRPPPHATSNTSSPGNTETSTNSANGTNVLANITTLPHHKTSHTNGYNRQVRRGTIIARVPANNNTSNSNNDDISPRHCEFPPPPQPRQVRGTKGSRWSASVAAQSFGAQLRQFDHGERQFLTNHRPMTRDITAMTNLKMRHTSCRQHDPTIEVTALQLAPVEGSAFREVSCALSKFWNDDKYGHAPREKPSNSIRLVMENFNSLCITSRNKKITAINNLCCNFRVDLLCGCETQVDWRMVPNTRQFDKLFGRGTETRSVIAHNINEHMLTNQYGGCAIMAMNTISAKVQETGVDGTGLGRWCWIRLGSGPRKTRIVMAYQPSNSSRSSAGTTVKDQQSRYFCARGDARSLMTIFFEQLIAQLLL
jgi:hypothetical protein